MAHNQSKLGSLSQDALQCASSHSEPASGNLYNHAHRAPGHAEEGRDPCKPFLAYLSHFNSLSIFHSNDKRHHTCIREIYKLDRLVRLVEAKIVRHAEKL